MGKKAQKALAALVVGTDKKELRTKHKEIKAEIDAALKDNDSMKIKAMHAASKLGKITVPQKDAFDERFANKTIKQIPCDVLWKKWLLQVPGQPIKKAEAPMLQKVDSSNGLKLFQRVHVAGVNAGFGPLLHVEWYAYWNGRLEWLGGWPTIVLTPNFEIDWGVSGHYTLEPTPSDTPADADDDFRYTHLRFRGVSFPIDYKKVDTILRRGYRVALNWDYISAYVYHPKNVNNQTPCKDILYAAWDSIVAELDKPSAPIATQDVEKAEAQSAASQLCLEAGTQQVPGPRPAASVAAGYQNPETTSDEPPVTAGRLEVSPEAPSPKQLEDGRAASVAVEQATPHKDPTTESAIAVTSPGMRVRRASKGPPSNNLAMTKRKQAEANIDKMLKDAKSSRPQE